MPRKSVVDKSGGLFLVCIKPLAIPGYGVWKKGQKLYSHFILHRPGERNLGWSWLTAGHQIALECRNSGPRPKGFCEANKVNFLGVFFTKSNMLWFRLNWYLNILWKFTFSLVLEGTARYAGLLVAPAEGFSQGRGRGQGSWGLDCYFESGPDSGL